MVKYLIIGLGGFVGAISRYLVAGWAQRPGGASFPVGTLTVNLLGCFFLGAFMAFAARRPGLSPEVRVAVAIGFLGAFTTFSTFGYETLAMAQGRQLLWAFGNVAGNVILGLAAVLLGQVAVRLALL